MCIFIEKTVIGTSFIKSKSSEEFIFTYLIPFDTGPCTSSLERKKIKFSSVVLRKSLEKRVKAYLKSVSKGLWKFIAFGFLDFGKTNAWLQVKELSFRLDKKNCTMLQKLSKYEVKAWLCWNLMILPPLRFCVKSYFGEFKRSKNVIYGNFRDAELWILVNLGLESCSDLLKI